MLVTEEEYTEEVREALAPRVGAEYKIMFNDSEKGSESVVVPIMNKTEKAPDRILIGEGDREIYERLKKTSFFEGKDNKDIFLMALAWGFHNGKSSPITNKETFFLLTTLEEHEKSIINAIAVYVKDDVEVLLNKKEVYDIAQEYGICGCKVADKMISDKEES